SSRPAPGVGIHHTSSTSNPAVSSWIRHGRRRNVPASTLGMVDPFYTVAYRRDRTANIRDRTDRLAPMAQARTPRSSWITQGLEVLADGGVDAVRVEPIAAQLGVTKRGFYGYFAGRDQLLTEMLATWEQ